MCFLVYKAIATPRAGQTPMLAVLYKDGIVYYSITFFALLWATLMWRAASYVYLGIPLYSTWMVLQVAMSRLLLSIRSTQAVYLHKSNNVHESEPMADIENRAVQGTTAKSTKPNKVTFAPSPTEKRYPTHHSHPSQISQVNQLSSFFEMTVPKGWRRGGSRSSDAHPYGRSYGHSRDASTISASSTGGADWFWWVGSSRRPQTPSEAGRTSLGDDFADPYDYMRRNQRYASWL